MTFGLSFPVTRACRGKEEATQRKILKLEVFSTKRRRLELLDFIGFVVFECENLY